VIAGAGETKAITPRLSSALSELTPLKAVISLLALRPQQGFF
jgi:hypothetical protein